MSGRTWKCCPCCDDPKGAQGDHVSHGGAVEQNGHDGPCTIHQDNSEARQRALAAAWEEGHKTRWRRGPDECQCCAYSAGECACGKYGTGELLSLAANPYREASS